MGGSFGNVSGCWRRFFLLSCSLTFLIISLTHSARADGKSKKYSNIFLILRNYKIGLLFKTLPLKFFFNTCYAWSEILLPYFQKPPKATKVENISRQLFLSKSNFNYLSEQILSLPTSFPHFSLAFLNRKGTLLELFVFYKNGSSCFLFL